MTNTFFSTSDTTGRRVDFSEIVDSVTVMGAFCVPFLLFSPHVRFLTGMAAIAAVLIAFAISVALHRRAEVERDRRSNHVYRITARTIKTLETVHVPDDVLEGLKELLAQAERTRAAFKKEVRRTLGIARSQEWLATILLYSETLPPSPTVKSPVTEPSPDDVLKMTMERPLF